MRKILSVLSILFLLTSNSWATVGWNKAIPATSENPQAISPDVIENNTAVDLMLQNYRDGGVYVKLISTSEIDIGPGGVMLHNSGGSTRLMVANSSLTAMSSTNIDTGSISPSSTYYIYAYASSTTATTFSVIYSASSTSPTGITYYQQIGNFTTDGSSNFSTATSNINPQTGAGTAVSKSFGSIYQAATDGFVNAYYGATSASGTYQYMDAYTDSNSTPTTELCKDYMQFAGPSGFFKTAHCEMYVKKGNYWEVTESTNQGGSGGLYFTPIGN